MDESVRSGSSGAIVKDIPRHKKGLPLVARAALAQQSQLNCVLKHALATLIPLGTARRSSCNSCFGLASSGLLGGGPGLAW